MNAWTDKPTSPVAGRRDDPAARTSSCDEFCLLLGPTRLHTIACDMANRRDPILDRRIA